MIWPSFLVIFWLQEFVLMVEPPIYWLTLEKRAIHESRQVDKWWLLCCAAHREPPEDNVARGSSFCAPGRRRVVPHRQPREAQSCALYPRALARRCKEQFFLKSISFFKNKICVSQPKLNMAKCRRNVENFLLACRKMGVREVRRVKLIASNDTNLKTKKERER